MLPIVHYTSYKNELIEHPMKRKGRNPASTHKSTEPVFFSSLAQKLLTPPFITTQDCDHSQYRIVIGFFSFGWTALLVQSQKRRKERCAVR